MCYSLVIPKLDPEKKKLLARVTRARTRWERAELHARETALLAVEGGVPQSHVADALGITRMTLWRWQHQPQTAEEPR